MSNPIVDRLTAAGAPFEFADIEVRGVPCHVFRDTPPYLSILYRNLAAFADRTLVVYEGRRLSYADATRRAAALASALKDQHGVGPGSRVAIVMRNCPEWLMSFMAVTSPPRFLISAMTCWVRSTLISRIASDVYLPNMKNVFI